MRDFDMGMIEGFNEKNMLESNFSSQRTLIPLLLLVQFLMSRIRTTSNWLSGKEQYIPAASRKALT